MARTFVFNDNLSARVEIVDPDGDNEFTAVCVGCGTDVVADSNERFHFEDAVAEAETHVDRCQRCADADCRNDAAHDRGHRCRKPI